VVDYSYISKELPKNTECFVLDSVTSTNDYLTALPISDNIQLCVAREQTSGKGQYDRTWLSKKDSSALFSLRINFSSNVDLSGLSLVVGIALIEVLDCDYGVSNLKLKWPNDVYFTNKKLAGILIENTVQNDSQNVVIGVGVNNSIKGELGCETPWIDLYTIMNITPNISTLTARLANKVIKCCQQFEKKGLKQFYSRWTELDYLVNKKVKLKYKGESLIGIANGISEQGSLLVRDNENVIEVFSSEQIKLI